ncbi:MAG: hypothetical protein HUU20_18025 [Pirellulales bacterium]|nr:hypothetical protein [Pirellulales bacterium]
MTETNYPDDVWKLLETVDFFTKDHWTEYAKSPHSKQDQHDLVRRFRTGAAVSDFIQERFPDVPADLMERLKRESSCFGGRSLERSTLEQLGLGDAIVFALGQDPELVSLYHRPVAGVPSGGNPDRVFLTKPSKAALAARRMSKGKAPKRTGRPRKDETDKSELLIDALAIHHQYESGGSIGNDEHATVRNLADLASDEKRGVKVSIATVSRFFHEKFPGHGHKGYVVACRTKKIGSLLALWQGEGMERHPDLLNEEYGLGADD